MTAFSRAILCIGLSIGIFWFFTRHTPDMRVVYPDNCVFIIDSILSETMQLEIKNFIDQAYKKNKTPSGLLPKIESHFPAVKSIIIDMLHPDALDFTIQAYHPLFMINDEHVICEHGVMLSPSLFTQQALKACKNISFDGVPIPKNIDRLTKFYTSLQDDVLENFSIRWIDKHAIWLDQKLEKGYKSDLSLLVGYDVVPNKYDIMQCRNLRNQVLDKPCKDKRGKPCKQNTTWVCDLRFDRQIVLFSTNKGV